MKYKFHFFAFLHRVITIFRLKIFTPNTNSEKIEIIDNFRIELKMKLSPENYITFWHMVVNHIYNILTKIINKKIQKNYFQKLIIMLLVNLIIGFVISLILKEHNILRLELIPLEIILSILSLIFIMAYLLYSDMIVFEFRNYLIDSIDNDNDLMKINSWFDANKNKKMPLIFGVAFSLCWMFFAPFFVDYSKGGFLGYGVLTSVVLNIFPIGTAIYYLFLILRLPLLLGRCSYHIFFINPSSSYLIKKISNMLSKSVIIVGILAATTTFAFSASGMFNFIGILFICIIGWVPLFILFIVNQYTLSKIIVSSKWKKINDLQQKIGVLEEIEGIPTKEKIERLTSLIEYHNRIMTTPNSMINLKTITGLVDSMILPIIALVISNIQVIIGLFN